LIRIMPAHRRRWLHLGRYLVIPFAAFIGLLGVVMLALVGSAPSSGGCGGGASGPAASIVLGPPGSGQRVGATEYGGPGDPSSGTVGSMGVSLLANPDSYAELGGTTFQTATAMGGLAYMTPLRITWGDHSAIAYKRDIGLGGGPVDGLPRVIDLWWQFAGSLGIPYENGLWSGPVRIERPPATGAAGVLGQTPSQSAGAAPGTSTGGNTASTTSGAASTSCVSAAGLGVPLTSGPRAVLLPDGQAEAPADAPAAVKGIIAAGNQIVGKPYVYGASHGLPLNEVGAAYDCSSSVEHLLWGGGLLPVDFDAASSELESFGQPGPGRWVTIYASADHVFMYVAGLRWDTHNAAGPDDGTTGIGWHPLVREDDGFVARHPAGL
jgi:cell wall-associated NlpC family hydrolase